LKRVTIPTKETHERTRIIYKTAIIADADSRTAAHAKVGSKRTKDRWRPAFAGTYAVCLVRRAHETEEWR
jgi:hypothetical protein